MTGAPLFDYHKDRPILQGSLDVWGDLDGKTLADCVTSNEMVTFYSNENDLKKFHRKW